MDTRTAEQRRRIMQAVKSKNTAPEMILRRLIYSMGYRYRLHGKHLPGNPDLVFGKRRKVIFVHGCFWHGHGCSKGRLPKSRLGFWRPKIAATKKRDARVIRELRTEGWESVIIWQCQLSKTERVKQVVRLFLDRT